VNVPELMQLAHSREHFADVEPCMFLLEDTRVVEQCPKVASRHVFHGEVNMRRILKGVQQTDQPGRFRRSENVSLHEDMPDLGEAWSRRKYGRTGQKPTYLIHLEQCPFTHFLQSAYFASLLLPCQIHLTVSALSDLSYDVELLHPQFCTPSPQKYTLASTIRLELFIEVRWGEVARSRIFIECGPTLLARTDVAQELEIVIKEI
jgi:hypothetical protein